MDIQWHVEKFAQHLHHTFTATLVAEGIEGPIYQVELIEVTRLPSRPKPTWGRASELPFREHPFSLVFRFPKKPAYSWIACTLTHPTEGVIGDLTLSPIDEDSCGRYYEAIFN